MLQLKPFEKSVPSVGKKKADPKTQGRKKKKESIVEVEVESAFTSNIETYS